MFDPLLIASQGETSHKILGPKRSRSRPPPLHPDPVNSVAFPPLHSIAARTGIEPSRIQFLIREFSEFLTTGWDDDRGIVLLRRIHQRFFIEGKPIPVIRRELGDQRRQMRVIAVTSGKGGVGKTTVSINLAIALAQRGLRTLLFDADLGMANVHVYAGVTPRMTLLDVVEGRAVLAQVLTSGPGEIKIVCGASGVSRLADLDARAIEFLVNLQLGLEDTDKLSQQTILLTYSSPRVTNRGPVGQPDLIERPGLQIDFVARQGLTIGGAEVEVKFEARNLTNSKYTESQTLNGTSVFNNFYERGRSFSIGVSAKF